MPACGKLRAFLWRRLFLQTIRRHYVALLVEIVFVLVTFKYFLRADRVDLSDVRKFNSTLLTLVNRQRINLTGVNLSDVVVVYGPSNSRTDELINKLLGKSYPRYARQKATAGMHNKYTDYEHVLQPTYRDTTDERPSNKLNDWLLQDGDDVDNHPNDRSVATTPARDGIYHEERQIDADESRGPIPIVDASAVAANCCGTISRRIKFRTPYKDLIKRIICIEFASDSANSISAGGLAYNIVIPVPPNVAFPREVLSSAHEIIQHLMVLLNDDVVQAISVHLRHSRGRNFCCEDGWLFRSGLLLLTMLLLLASQLSILQLCLLLPFCLLLLPLRLCFLRLLMPSGRFVLFYVRRRSIRRPCQPCLQSQFLFCVLQKCFRRSRLRHFSSFSAGAPGAEPLGSPCVVSDARYNNIGDEVNPDLRQSF
ncbi:hypothetical protein MTO96_041229 [Rhipicephalus appendiculatus]